MVQVRRRRARAAPLSLEREHWARGEWVAGVDEVGVGPLAGPVVAAAVVLEPDRGVRGARDSKALTPELREELFLEIQQTAVAIGVGAASTREIERYNIYRATHLAMRRALARLSVKPAHVLVDGRPVPDLGWAHTAVVKGDAKSQSIACASIIAKVLRDRLMRRLAPRYPGYGWEHNAGYSTAEHMAALKTLGPTPHHRNTFTPVAQLDLELGR